jgi:hypothetical protein
MAGRKGQARRLDKLIHQARQVIGLLEQEAGCPACAGRQRIVREGDPAACELCGRDDGAIIVTEIVVETAEDVRAATAAALAAGHELIGPFARGGCDDDDQASARQVIEAVEGGPWPDAGGE